MKNKLLLLFFVLLLDCAFLQAQNSVHLAFISDTQKPMWFEAVVVPRNNNEKATELLFRHIASDTVLTAVIHLGDVTESSSREKSWKRIDSLLNLLYEMNIDVFAMMGNHDYLYKASEGEKNFKKRFPAFQKKGFTLSFGTLAVIMLNSNFSNLLDNEKKHQQRWYLSVLDSLDRDTSVTAVIVGCHHSPFSNNTIVGYSTSVQEAFVLPFLKSNKARVFVSGHSHAFEHFRIEGKDFLVLGGGGGLQHTLLIDDKQCWEDLFPNKTKKRMFHYVRLTATADELNFVVLMVKKDFSGVEPVYEIKISQSEGNTFK